MKISGNTPLFPWNTQETALSALQKKTEQKTASESLSQFPDQAVKLTLSKEGLAQYHGQLSSAAQPEDIKNRKEEMLSMDEIPSYCQSINFGISLGRDLQEIGRKYAEKYDEIIQNHGKGNRVVIHDEQTGELRDATLEEKLAVLDRSFEYALEFEQHLEKQRPAFIHCLEQSAKNYRASKAVDLAEEIEYRVEKLKRIPKLPENFQENMLKIRESFKAVYSTSSKDNALKSMLESINQLFPENQSDKANR